MSDCRFGVSPVTILILILILKFPGAKRPGSKSPCGKRPGPKRPGAKRITSLASIFVLLASQASHILDWFCFGLRLLQAPG